MRVGLGSGLGPASIPAVGTTWHSDAAHARAVTTPTEEQLYARLSPDLQRKVDAIRAARENPSQVKEQLQVGLGRLRYCAGHRRRRRPLTPMPMPS